MFSNTCFSYYELVLSLKTSQIVASKIHNTTQRISLGPHWESAQILLRFCSATWGADIAGANRKRTLWRDCAVCVCVWSDAFWNTKHWHDLVLHWYCGGQQSSMLNRRICTYVYIYIYIYSHIMYKHKYIYIYTKNNKYWQILTKHWQIFTRSDKHLQKHTFLKKGMSLFQK